MKPIIITPNTDDEGRIIISKSEFQEIIDEVYEQGYNDGKRNSTYVPPQRYGSPSAPYFPKPLEITCSDVSKEVCSAEV